MEFDFLIVGAGAKTVCSQIDSAVSQRRHLCASSNVGPLTPTVVGPLQWPPDLIIKTTSAICGSDIMANQRII